MTRREYLERRLERREEWAGKAQARSNQQFARVHKIADGIPLGQPILVGHHSQRHAERDAERIDNGMRKGIEEQHLAEHHASKASGLARQLDHSIFSDEDNAVAALEARIAEREAKAAGYVALNAAWRKSKGDVATFTRLAGISEATGQHIADTIAKAYSWEKQPIPAYTLTNLRATIRKDKERIEEIKARTARTEKATAAGGVLVEGTGDYCRVTFDEKPARSTIDALKAAGFSWGGGSWAGRRDRLPEGIA